MTLNERIEDLLVQERIVVAEILDAGSTRYSDEHWEKIQPLAVEYLTALEEQFDVMVDTTEEELEAVGCELSL